jgi:putative transcriptional regulator
MKSMGEHIYALRVNKNMTRAEFARQCNVTKQYIWLIETGKRDPGLKLAIRIADVLGVTLNDLMGVTR